MIGLNQLSGINTVMYYSATILEGAGFAQANSVWLAALCDFVQVLGHQGVIRNRSLADCLMTP